MRNHLSGMLILLAGLGLVGSALLSPLYAAESGCVQCHTNEKILRSLHAPVKVEISEGVG